jgi:hypothetical protein
MKIRFENNKVIFHDSKSYCSFPMEYLNEHKRNFQKSFSRKEIKNFCEKKSNVR